MNKMFFAQKTKYVSKKVSLENVEKIIIFLESSKRNIIRGGT